MEIEVFAEDGTNLSVPEFIFNTFDDIINFMDHPLKSSVDPRHVYSGYVVTYEIKEVSRFTVMDAKSPELEVVVVGEAGVFRRYL